MKGREWLSGALPLSYHGTLLRVITKPNQPRTNKKIQTKKKEPELSVFMGSALLRRFPPPPLPGPALRKSPAGNPPQASQTTEDHPFKIIVGTGRCIKPRTPCALISDLRVPVLLRVNGVAYLLSPLPHPVPVPVPFPLRLGSVWLSGFILSCTMMATRTSSISNARAPTHRARPASSSLKTHRRSLLCRAEDTQTSGTFSLSCVVLFVIVFYAQ